MGVELDPAIVIISKIVNLFYLNLHYLILDLKPFLRIINLAARCERD